MAKTLQAMGEKINVLVCWFDKWCEWHVMILFSSPFFAVKQCCKYKTNKQNVHVQKRMMKTNKKRRIDAHPMNNDEYNPKPMRTPLWRGEPRNITHARCLNCHPKENLVAPRVWHPWVRLSRWILYFSSYSKITLLCSILARNFSKIDISFN